MAKAQKQVTDVAVPRSAEEQSDVPEELRSSGALSAGSGSLPSTDVIDMTAYAGMGREEARAEDYSIPFLRILQKGSHEVDESDGKYIPGAKPGDFINTVTQQIFPGKLGLKVIPCLFHREYVEWIPRDAGGGFVASYQANDPIVATAKAPPGERDLKLPNGHDLIDTYYEYVICETPGGEVFPAVISFTSTQTKKIRRWNSMMAQKRLTLPNGQVLPNPPDFAFYYNVTSVVEKNDMGSWYGWNVTPVEKPGDIVPVQMFREALQFHKQIKSGEVKRAPEVDDTRREADGGEFIPGFEDSLKVF